MNYRFIILFEKNKLFLWSIVLMLVSFGVSNAQSGSKILLVYPSLENCDITCQEDTKTFRSALKSALWETGLFKDTLSSNGFKRENLRRNLKNYCAQRQIKYYLNSAITKLKISGNNYTYKISFQLFDLNNENIENPEFDEFDIDIEKPGTMTDSITKVLTEELTYFMENDFHFKPLIKVLPFDKLDPDQITVHITEFPKWLADELNQNKVTNRVFRFYYKDDKIYDLIDKNYINGNLGLISENDSLKVVFWMNDEQQKANIVIYKQYKAEDEQTVRTVINQVRVILNNYQ